MKNFIILICSFIAYCSMTFVNCDKSTREEERDPKNLKAIVSSSLNHPCKLVMFMCDC